MKRLLRSLLIALPLLLLAGYGADRMLKSREHPGLVTFVKQWLTNYPRSFSMEPEVLRITVNESDLQALEEVVEQARERGVILPEGNEYVDAEFTNAGRSFSGRLRIKGKLNDHVQGSKWSFRVIARKDGGFLGMKRFSLQHPGTRNYLYDWLYHKLSAGEGIIALRYGFCKVVFNDEDLGVYAYEEHFGGELLEHNARLPGPIVRFDPALFWVHRLNMMEGRSFEEAYATYQAAALDAYDTGDIMKDPEQRAVFEEAVGTMNAFRNAQRSVAGTFDVDRLARRHALLDLVGGHHSMDWSDVKFYYDPVAHRFEPVSYESFSAFRIRDVSGAYRHVGTPYPGDDLHDQLFKDPTFFRAYVHHLERMSHKAYLDSAFTALAGALDSAEATLYGEFPYKELDRSIYTYNQGIIRRQLHPPKACHVYLQRATPDSLYFMAVPILGLPLELKEVVMADDVRLPVAGAAVMPSRRRNAVGEPFAFAVRAPSGPLDREALRLECSILGASKTLAVEVFPFALLAGDQPRLQGLDGNTVRQHAFLVVDDTARTVTCVPGRHVVTEDIVVPEGYTFRARSPLRIELRGGARFVSRSPVEWSGTPEDPILITSTDTSGAAVTIAAEKGASRMEHVIVPSLRSYRSRLEAVACQFTTTEVLLGKARFEACRWSGGRDQLLAVQADVALENCVFAGASDDAVSQDGGSLTLREVEVRNAQGSAFNLGREVRVSGDGVRISDVRKGIDAAEGTAVELKDVHITNATVGVEADRERMRYRKVTVVLRNVVVKDCASPYLSGQGGTILLDGERVGEKELVKGT